ncbi:Phenylpropionate dioxygenase and related ring-hydroxylating dioxygenases, large terminal subunit [hydrothermal vent metagenome]|uniref:Phenylpropionate dioxygenase and related ring-hydroxylating dioxygenases, large terminal subunit n=1 Tax=hydrothermal vent metagenome TaxID=652676 RepID=A0A3B0RFF0_9ZZZZ
MSGSKQSKEKPDPLDGHSLPAWCYDDADFYKAECEKIFAASWQVVCHENDIAKIGAWHTLDFLGESIIVVRSKDQKIRAFTNVCRHRGSRLVAGKSGCNQRLTCPYHAWTYDLQGNLVGVPHRDDYPGLDTTKHGLVPVELENWRGFLFVRLQSSGPSVAQMMAPFEQQIAPYRFEELQALGRVTLRPRTVNWKNIADNYSDGLHIPVAHPGLTRLFGRSYGIEADTHVDRMWGDMQERPSANISERLYQAFLPELAHLPASHQRRWLYFKLWPNVAFDIYPDQVDFMQFLPISPTETMIREISYALPDERREMRAARYLNWRINRQVNAEDTALVQDVQSGMASASFSTGPLGKSEVCLRHFCQTIRKIIPQARQNQRPAPGWSSNTKGQTND